MGVEANSKSDDEAIFAQWKPRNLISGAILLIGFGLLFLATGVILYYKSGTVKQYKIRYDDIEECRMEEACRLDFELPESIGSPIYVYYEIQKFYQNHKQFLETFSWEQLRGEASYDESVCQPLRTNGELGKIISVEGDLLEANETGIPCGYMAKTMFNDRYRLYRGNARVEVNEGGISWDEDRRAFKNGDRSAQWIDLENEHLQVWMRPAPTNYFKKLWGKIETKLEAGKYSLIVDNNYDLSLYKGRKYFVLSTLTTNGGQQQVLVLGYLFSGIIMTVLGMLLVYLDLSDRRKY